MRELGCGSAGKHPRIKGWRPAAISNGDQIRTWWARWSDANIGVATRGLLVIDIDAGGDQSLRQLEQLYGSLPPTMTVSTGGPGTHFFYRRPPERKIACNVRRLGPRIDVRGDGGFVIAHPSRHGSGDLYTLQVAISLAEAPTWLVDLLTTPASNERRRLPHLVDGAAELPDHTVTPEGRKRLRGVYRAVAGARPGRRHATLYWAARQCGAFVERRLVSADTAADALAAAAAECGLLGDDGRAR